MSVLRLRVDSADAGEMCRHAAARRTVVLSDGSRGVLRRWPVRRARGHRGDVGLTVLGRYAYVKPGEVEWVEVPLDNPTEVGLD